MRPLFKDASLQAQFEDYGYVTVPGLDATKLDHLRQRYDGMPRVDDAGVFITYLSTTSQKRITSGVRRRPSPRPPTSC